jgi:2-oxoacid:acceptor oxidoreductase delta subunit (pyruvate/2-ketoisovalerate family)
MTLPDWKTLTPGGVIVDAGNAVEYDTGTWRAERPIVEIEKCTHCLFCWLFCPEGTIETVEGRFVGIDMDHCKGCGICAVECPPKALRMVPESANT